LNINSINGAAILKIHRKHVPTLLEGNSIVSDHVRGLERKAYSGAMNVLSERQIITLLLTFLWCRGESKSGQLWRAKAERLSGKGEVRFMPYL
jgi:hypothetical protein